MKTYKIVRVEWEDISSYSAWRDIKDVKKCEPLKVVSVGTLVKGTRGNVAIVQMVAENKDVGATQIIPKHNVRKMEVVGSYRL